MAKIEHEVDKGVCVCVCFVFLKYGENISMFKGQKRVTGLVE